MIQRPVFSACLSLSLIASVCLRTPRFRNLLNDSLKSVHRSLPTSPLAIPGPSPRFLLVGRNDWQAGALPHGSVACSGTFLFLHHILCP